MLLYKQYRRISPAVLIIFCALPDYSVTAASAVVLIAAATAAVSLVVSASAVAVVARKNEDENDEKNPVAVASVTKKHSVDLLSHLPLHLMSMCEMCDYFNRRI